MRSLYHYISNDEGFTLIELIATLAIISLLLMVSIMKLPGIMSAKRENFAIMTGVIAKSFDDSFLSGKTNYLLLHLNSPDPANDPSDEERYNKFFDKVNGYSIININNGKYAINKRKALRPKEFSSGSFLLEEVVYPSGLTINQGTVIIPFYPQGYSDNLIIHLLVDGDNRWSIRIDKHIKEPQVKEGYLTYNESG